ncbi:hypothetical protein GGX14DRAFT_368689 [Mycena pura]|uniref:DUF6589 domain-containing protein n=1 Tax=Mycena pura TaxID=153505 RepID=A0AAD6VB08_9AGAR|nr:hypothetical protein GGX14DRAFT_368689 [Mycena pura]
MPLPPSPTVSPEYSPLSARLRQLHLDAAETPPPTPIAPRQSKKQHLDSVLQSISENFESLGDFMEALSENIPSGTVDSRSERHKNVLSAWLSGHSRFRPVHFVQAIYRNRYSVPHYRAVHVDELSRVFDANCDLDDIHYARVALSIWATQLVGRRCALEVGALAKDDPKHPEFQPHLQASTNERMRGKRKTVTQDDVFSFSMQNTADIIRSRAPASWFLTECMAAPRKNGAVIVKKRRPHPFIQAAALSAFAISRNRSANGYFALPMGIWLFASKAHSNVKRIMSRLGFSVHDSTVREALTTMGEERKKKLQEDTAEALTQKMPFCRKVLDNIQQYQSVHEHGIGKTAQMITGTAATAIRLDGCRPGAFDLDEYQKRLVQNERAQLTTDSLLDDIDFGHLQRVLCLHIVLILCKHVPSLNVYMPQISQHFRSDPIAKHRMEAGRKTGVIPLSANSYMEMSTHEMKEAEMDFDRQVGYTPDNTSAARILIWDAGDGGSVLSGGRVMKHLLPQAVSLNAYDSFENRIWTPGLFHKRLNMVNAIAENHYGPRATKDPSALARSAAATDLYIPPKLSNCDFYPTVRTMRTVCEAQILDIWDLHYAKHEGLLPHFARLASQSALPSLADLISYADSLVSRYISTTAWQTALDRDQFNKSTELHKFMLGPAWNPVHGEAANEPDSAAHVEAETFAGDRVLANFILFRRDFLLWLELSDALADGDIGRVVEVLKIWTFMFAGASKQNYATILLELYCLFRYEASKDLKDAIWNNWLINLLDELGK